ncbi:MAG: Flp pilus assembly complex ATPase component TadA [Firmicutes bacterium]|nr:Flp pilus assembly complex ATPase component TadA [Bacillota bacterium]
MFKRKNKKDPFKFNTNDSSSEEYLNKEDDLEVVINTYIPEDGGKDDGQSVSQEADAGDNVVPFPNNDQPIDSSYLDESSSPLVNVASIDSYITKTEERHILEQDVFSPKSARQTPGEEPQKKKSSKEDIYEEKVARMIAKQLNIEFIDICSYKIDEKAVSLISKEEIRHYHLLPVGFEEGRIIAAISGKTNIAAINELNIATGHYVVPVVTTDSALQKAINKYAGAGKEDEIEEIGYEPISTVPLSEGKLPSEADGIAAKDTALDGKEELTVNGEGNKELWIGADRIDEKFNVKTPSLKLEEEKEETKEEAEIVEAADSEAAAEEEEAKIELETAEKDIDVIIPDNVQDPINESGTTKTEDQKHPLLTSDESTTQELHNIIGNDIQSLINISSEDILSHDRADGQKAAAVEDINSTKDLSISLDSIDEVVLVEDVELGKETKSMTKNADALETFDLNTVSEADVARNVAKQLHIDFVDLASYEINPQALSLVSSEHIGRYKLLPIDFMDNKLVVAMADPTDIFTIDDLRVMTGYEIVPVVAAESELLTAISRYRTGDIAVQKALENIDSDFDQKADHLEIDENSEDAPVVKLVTLIVTEAFREGASDIFIEPQEKEVRVRYRIDGVLQEVMRSPKHVQASIIQRIKIMSGLDIAERRLPQDGRFGLVIDKKNVDFRVATLPTIHGEQVVLRLLEKGSSMPALDDLGFLPDSLEKFKASFSKPYGAILITGPTGSGKTTTLYSVLNILNATEKNLITVEDPVEYRLPGINQVQVNTRAGLTFASALRSILRHDPDIIMIGEIRDEETATIAIESALTGHLVLSTLHTNTAPATLTRLIEMGIEPFLVSSAVDCIVAQRLARKLCTKCKESYKPTKEELKEAGYKIDGSEPVELYRARGCKFCGNTGYQGRIGIYEVMSVSESIERVLVGKFTVEDINRIAISEGMRTLREDGLEKVRSGLTSIEEIARVTM